MFDMKTDDFHFSRHTNHRAIDQPADSSLHIKYYTGGREGRWVSLGLACEHYRVSV